MPARAMVDCGGQGSFINDKLSQNYQLPHLSKPFPVSFVLADGTSSGTRAITEYNPLLLRTATNEEPFSLNIAPISHDLILGMTWLRLHNPSVLFGSNLMFFDSPYYRENCRHYSQTIPLLPVPPLALQTRKQSDTPTLDQLQPVVSGPMTVPIGSARKRKEARRDPKRPKEAPATVPRGWAPGPLVSTIGAYAFAMACNRLGALLFTMSCASRAAELASVSIAPEQEPDLSTIPSKYHEFADLFSEK
jgi:hypothetical protein